MDERCFSLSTVVKEHRVQLRKAKAKFSKINHIFISHLHGDHCFGLLPDLLLHFYSLGRDQELHVYGPKGIKKMLETIFEITETHRGFPIIYHELEGDQSQKVYEDDKLEVWTIPLDHQDLL